MHRRSGSGRRSATGGRSPGRRRQRRARRSEELAAAIPGWLDQLRRGEGPPGKAGLDGRLRVDWAHLARVLDCGAGNFQPGMASRRLIEASDLPLEDGARLQAPITARAAGHRKFGSFADGMLFTPAGREQATRLAVAARHAQRFAAAGIERVADLGCGIGAGPGRA